MIAPVQPQSPKQKHGDLVIVLTIDRPRKELPEGFISMTATAKPPLSFEEAADGPITEETIFEEAADGPITEETIQAVIRDLRSYIANGRKAFANEVQRDDEPGGRAP